MDKAKRKAIIAGNWKMNKTASEAAVLVDELVPAVQDAGCEVVICTPYTDLVTAVEKTKGTNIHVGAENVHFEKSGAFTGEISADMLVDLGVEYVIVGHSERRQYFAETDQTVNKRALAALNAGLKVIICVGESLQQREEGVTEELVRMQTKIALRDVTAEQMANVVIAYEPIWAIGTGKTATADQAEEVCAAIRKVVGELYGEDAAKALTVQYGGSMNPKNAEELLGKPDVDGGLIGGSGLAGADGPDGLVGDDDVLQFVSGHAVQRDLDLHTDQLLGHALLALVEALADADDGLQAAGQSSLGALVDGLVGLGKVLAALAVADNDVLNAEVGQHVSADLAGEGTGLLKVDILGADVDVGALGHLDSGDKVGKGNADDDLTAGVLDSGDQLVDEGLSLGSGLVHFPVAGDDGFTILFIHGNYSFLE